jgi:hypothetical protein
MTSGAIALANATKNMGALSLPNLASNKLGGVSDWMKPPREDIKLGDRVDGNPVVGIEISDIQ